MINRFIDHTNLKNTVTETEIVTLCEEAKQHNFKAVCVPPCYVKLAASELKDCLVRVCTVVGFPYGYSTTNSKVYEAMDACLNGANEIDMVLNIAKLKQNDFDYLVEEINAVKKAIKNIPLKVIVETSLLTNEEKLQACEIINSSNANFIKTSTGTVGGATLEDVSLLHDSIKEGIEIKASGGIHDWENAKEMIKVGASRIGTSHGVEIMNGFELEKNLNSPVEEDQIDLFSDNESQDETHDHEDHDHESHDEHQHEDHDHESHDENLEEHDENNEDHDHKNHEEHDHKHQEEHCHDHDESHKDQMDENSDLDEEKEEN